MITINLAKPKRVVNPALLKHLRNLPCASCGRQGYSDPSHIRSVGAGGPDTPWNVFPHCRDCHMVWHRVGWRKFMDKFPKFKLKLLEAGWIVDMEGCVLWHPELRTDV